MTENRVFAAGEHIFRIGNDSTLYYTVHGDGLVSLYGRYTLLLLELRGNGKSSRPPASQMASWNLAEDVEFLRQELKLERIPYLMGHSGGGTVATWYAIRLPERVENLVLLNHQLEGFDNSESMKAILQQKQKDPELRPALGAWTASWDNASDKEFAAFFRNFFQLWNYHLLHGKNSSQRSQEAELDSVRARTLLIFATDDPICTPTQGMATKNGIAGSEMVVYDKCGHFPWIEKKEEVIKELQEFFPETHPLH
ncbi:unnamed protein product [Clonostachys chloroleuca]|uniref:AB hydrolase-1 domain-containing protein n=1 Tax=Clonostachys chloroleuca TaxID=1926264 RepID=A0AA35Q6P3_9HYPO|nr:unnamed protein product [Clonostachys chloroleuca]